MNTVLSNKIFIFTLLFILPFLAVAQKKDKKTKKHRVKNEVVTEKSDSLSDHSVQLDQNVDNVSQNARLDAMISKYGKNRGKMIAEGTVWPSISPEMAIDSWGEPEKIQRAELPTGSTERWIYPDGKYLYFKNGRLDSWKK